MINLTITGNSFAEINERLLDVVKGIGTGEHTVSHAIPASLEAMLTKQTSDLFKEAFQPLATTAPQELTTPLSEKTIVLGGGDDNKKKRRTKAEVEADKAAKLANAQAEVAAAQASHAPAPAIVIPPMPTTNHVVNIPAEYSIVPVVQQPTPQAPVVAPPLNQTGAYNLQTFKANLVPIISGLLTTGKLNSEWIAKTAKETFGGQDIWLWSANEPKIEELFNCFIEWNLIQKFEG